MSLPATVDDLLLLAEAEVTQLTDRLLVVGGSSADRLRPERPTPPLRAWPRFRYDASRAIRTTMGPRLPTHPVDEAVHTLSRYWKFPARRFDNFDEAEQQLVRIGKLLGAAGDLIVSAHPQADDAHATAARMAGLIGATARVLVVSAGRAGVGDSTVTTSLVRVGREAAAVLDRQGGRGLESSLDSLAAEPTWVLDGPAAQLTAASVAWRRASAACPPSSEVMILSAVMSGRVAVATWKLTERAIEVGALDESLREPARQKLRAAALAWGDVAAGWRNYVTADPRPETVRAAATELNMQLANLTGEGPGSELARDPATLLQLLEASQRSLGHVVALAADQAHVGTALAASGLLFEGRSKQRLTLEQLRLGHKFVSAPPEAGKRLSDAHRTALRGTTAAQCRLMPSRVCASRSPEVEQPQRAVVAAVPGPSRCR